MKWDDPIPRLCDIACERDRWLSRHEEQLLRAGPPPLKGRTFAAGRMSKLARRVMLRHERERAEALQQGARKGHQTRLWKQQRKPPATLPMPTTAGAPAARGSNAQDSGAAGSASRPKNMRSA